MDSHSSTSSFSSVKIALGQGRRTLIVALVIVGTGGAALSLVSGGVHGELPYPSFEGLDEAVTRYNRTRDVRAGEILLLGSSLMEYGIIENRLARDLGDSTLQVFNFGLPGGSPYETLHLVQRLALRGSQPPRLAVVELNRLMTNEREELLPHARAVRERLVWKRPADPRSLMAESHYLMPYREDLLEWLRMLRYGALPMLLPQLASIAAPNSHVMWRPDGEVLWREDPLKEPRTAARRLQPRSVSLDALAATRLTVDRLKHAGFCVVLFEAPVHTLYTNALQAFPDNARAESEYDAAFWNQASTTGVDGTLRIKNAAALNASDSIFVDYAHLRRVGAELQTDRLAKYLQETDLASGHCAARRQ